MRLLRTVRGIVGTAFSFTVPWAVFGALFAVATELMWPTQPPSLRGFDLYIRVVPLGALLFGTLGTAVGAAFATTLAASARRIAFNQLTGVRITALGMAGGAIVAGAFLGLLNTVSGGVWPATYTTGLALSTLLGGASAWAMFRVASRGADPESPFALHGADGGLDAPTREKASVSRNTT